VISNVPFNGNQLVVIFLHVAYLLGGNSQSLRDTKCLCISSVTSVFTETVQILGADSLNHWPLFFLFVYFQRNQMCFHQEHAPFLLL